MLKRGWILSGAAGLFSWAWLMFWFAGGATAAVLTHRYTFETDAADVIGNAPGVLQGNALLTNGAVVFDGTNSGVRLPDDLFTNYSSITFETWFVDEGASNVNAALYQFSSSSNGMNYTMFGLGTWSSNNVSQRVYIPMPVPGLTNHLVWTQDAVSKTAAVYVNGVMAARNTNFTLTPKGFGSTTNNWIGAGGAGSAVFKGRILEFRTYQGALTNLEVAQLCAAGPDLPDLNPGALQSIRIVVPSPLGPVALLSPGVFGDYANLTNVSLAGQTALVLSSDNTNVVAVTVVSNQVFPFQFSSPNDGLNNYTNVGSRTTSLKLRTRTTGTATVKAVYQSFSNSTIVTVVLPPDIALLHRYSFSEPAGSGVAHDSMGDAHGRLVGSSTGAAFDGSGALTVGQITPGYLKLPPAMVSGQSEISIEAWVRYLGVTRPGSWIAWSRIFDFGDQFNGVGKTYFFLTPVNDSNVSRAAASSNGIPSELTILDAANVFPVGVTMHVAVTYSPVRGIARYYINGTRVAQGSAPIPLAAINDVNCWLGRSLFIEDPYLHGTYYEFRVYSGLLQDADIAADYAAGPDVVGSDFLLHSLVSSNQLILTWGPSAAGSLLESSSTLGPGASWTQVAETKTFQNGRFTITLPITGDARFFRLHDPD